MDFGDFVLNDSGELFVRSASNGLGAGRGESVEVSEDDVGRGKWSGRE